MSTERKLKKLFDYQRFEQNDKLENLIRKSEMRYAKALSDDALAMVSAAGEPELDATSNNNTTSDKPQS